MKDCETVRRLSFKSETIRHIRDTRDVFVLSLLCLELLNDLNISEDNTETSINTRSADTARSTCSGGCGAGDVYYAVRKDTESVFKCKCIPRNFNTFMAEVFIIYIYKAICLSIHP